MKMQAKIINGKEIAEKIKKENIEILSKIKYHRKPKLLIFYFGYNVSSELYIKYKTNFANQCGVDAEVVHMLNATESEIINLIKNANSNNEVDGIMVQLPINLQGINTNNVIDSIDINKDVDGLTSHSLGNAWFYKNCDVGSCTALACMEIFKETNFDLDYKNVVIIGNTIVLGKPLAGMINNKHATISVLNSHTKNLNFYTKNADVIISATGKKRLIKPDMVKEGVLLIDVGTNKDENNKTHGDFDKDELINIASIISPSPGGVGPITVAILIRNTIKLFLKNIKEE